MKCFECKQDFNKESLVSYTSPLSTTSHNYCKNCLLQRQSRDYFSMSVCRIFGIKAPGPRIWTERKRLIEKYGYTDETLIDCLNYLYNIEKKQKLRESLCLINPESINRMMQYKEKESDKWKNIAQAIQQKVIETPVTIKENDNKRWKTSYSLNPDDWLDID